MWVITRTSVSEDFIRVPSQFKRRPSEPYLFLSHPSQISQAKMSSLRATANLAPQSGTPKLRTPAFQALQDRNTAELLSCPPC